jgi:hypothetical protein
MSTLAARESALFPPRGAAVTGAGAGYRLGELVEEAPRDDAVDAAAPAAVHPPHLRAHDYLEAAQVQVPPRPL